MDLVQQKSNQGSDLENQCKYECTSIRNVFAHVSGVSCTTNSANVSLGAPSIKLFIEVKPAQQLEASRKLNENRGAANRFQNVQTQICILAGSCAGDNIW